MELVRLSENTILLMEQPVVDAVVFQRVRMMAETIQQALADVIVDCVPAYHSIHITFSLRKISANDFIRQLESLISQQPVIEKKPSIAKVIHIPVYYGEEVAEDLTAIAEQKNLSKETVIRYHSERTYDIYAMGFLPGFAYLGCVDPRIATPRKKTPRKKVIRGSVAIADQQTAIYPEDSPGGWQIIGRTPLALVDYAKQDIALLTVGDKVKFDAISREAFFRLGGSF
jgi:KipI family sensor histidine kinase inhibitor